MYSVAVHQSLDDLMHGARSMMQWNPRCQDGCAKHVRTQGKVKAHLIIVRLFLPVRSTEVQYIMYLYHIYLLYIEVPKVNYTLPYFMILYSARVRPTPLGFSLSPESVRKNPGITLPTLPYPTAIPDKRSCSSGHPALRYFYPLLQYVRTRKV